MAAAAPAVLGVVAHIPDEGPRFVAVSRELLSARLSEVASFVRRSLCSALGLDEEENQDEFRLLFRQRDLDEEQSAAAFVKSLTGGVPCVVRVLFRLLGGKGGFGALLRKQAKRGKKTTNFDASRDLSGRRIRHSKAVERIKEWMEKNKRDDELVKLIVGEGPDLPKAPDPNDSLDPEYVNKLKRAAASRPGVVSEGLRRLLEEEEAARSDDASASSQPVGIASGSAAVAVAVADSTKRPRTVGPASGGGAASVDWLNAMGALGALGSISSPENDDGSASDEGGGGSGSAAAAAKASSSSSSAAAVAAAPAPAVGKAAKQQRLPQVGAAQADDDEDDFDEEEEEEADDEGRELPQAAAPRELPQAAAAGSVVSSSLANGSGKPLVGSAPDSYIAAWGAKAEKRESSRGARGGRGASAAVDIGNGDGPCLGIEDIARFATAGELEAKVSADDLKQSLLHFGLKCGGTPKERAARLFLLKSTALKDLPKSALAAKK